MGVEADGDDGDHRELAGRPEPLDLPGGGVRRRRHRQAAAAGGEALFQHRQSVAEDHAARARLSERGALLYRRQHARSAAAASTGAARDLPEISQRVSWQPLFSCCYNNDDDYRSSSNNISVA